MVVATLSQALDNLYTTTWQNMKQEAVDQIFDGSPFWFWMKEQGKLKKVEGGQFISEPLRYAKSDRVRFIGRGGTVELSENEFLTTARYDWKYMVDSIVRFGVDDQKNRGKNQIINLANAKLENSRDSLVDKMEEVLFGTNTADSLQYAGLQDAVPDDPTTNNNYGLINNNTYSWWRNQAVNMTGLSWATNGHSKMRTILNDCGKGMKMQFPDIILSGQTPYEYYEDSVLDQKRIVNQKLGDAGFENIEFKGIPMVWSPSCANTRMYFLCTRYLSFNYDPMLFFDMTAWKDIPDQPNDRAAQIVTAGELVCSRRRCQGVLHTIDTA